MPDLEFYKILAGIDYLTLSCLTSDPPLAKGRIWFRSDLGQLRYSPDGSTVYVIDPAPLVDKSWADTTPHYFNRPPYGTSLGNLSVIHQNSPATGHKRSFESAVTGNDYLYGWLLKSNAMISSRLDMILSIGAYHGYNATRAWLGMTIGDPATIDTRNVNNAVPWIHFNWSMSSLGYANGSYGRPLSGYIIFTSPPSYSFSPANPAVWYNMITGLPNGRRHILYGYNDGWAADWDQWASLQRGITYTNFRYRVATEPPKIEEIMDLTRDLPVDVAVIGRWDGEVRLWIERGDKGMVISLGRNVNIIDKRKTMRSISINMFEKILRSGREPERTCNYIELTLESDIKDRHGHGKFWRVAVLSYMDDLIDVAFGNREWDGDKYGYYVYSFM